MIDTGLFREVALPGVQADKTLRGISGGKNILPRKTRGQIVNGEMVAGGPAAGSGTQYRIPGNEHFSFAGGQ